MTEQSPNNPFSESDFELDLDRVFTPGQKAPAEGVSSSRITPAPRPQREGPPTPAEPPQADGEAATPRRGGKANFERRADDATKSFRRVVARPSTILAASVLDENRAAPSSSGNGEAVAESATGRRYSREDLPGLQPDKARALLEETFHVAPLPPEGNWSRRVLVVLAILAGSYAIWHISSTVWKSRQLEIAEQKPDEGAAAGERLVKARAVMQSYLGAKTIPDKLQHVLEPDRVRQLMVEFYENRRSADPVFPATKVVSQTPRMIGGRYLFGFQFKSAPEAPPIEMSLRETSTGYKIDWEGFVAFGALPWLKFCEERPATAIQMRVCAKVMTVPATPVPPAVPAPATNATPATPTPAPAPVSPAVPYLNNPQFECYQLEHYSMPLRLRGYAAPSDRVAQDLRRLMEKDGKPKLVNAYLRFEPGAEKDQVRIVDLTPESRQ